jgi:hypothetical protein
MSGLCFPLRELSPAATCVVVELDPGPCAACVAECLLDDVSS